MINYNSSNDNIIVQNMAMNLSKKATYHELGKNWNNNIWLHCLIVTLLNL